ncbi:MAG TPA: AAA family ATPase [Microbacteriaceae bacterium]|nr:AAA family ATPase [Microbacteriaceae bacterium]
MIDSIFVNGTVGSGKTTLAYAVSALETSITHAVIDLDEIRRLRPAPATDRFAHEIELRNLRSIATNYREAGAERFILAGVLEHEAEIGRYREALGSDGMFICRLTVAPDVVKRRLARRHERDQMGLIWHRDRAVELARILATNTFDDIVLDSSDVEPSRLASALRLAAGWD